MAKYLWEKYNISNGVIAVQNTYSYAKNGSSYLTLITGTGTSKNVYYSSSYVINTDGTFTLTGTIKTLNVPTTGIYSAQALYSYYYYAFESYDHVTNIFTVAASTTTYTYDDDEGTEYIGYRSNRYELTVSGNNLKTYFLASDSECNNDNAAIMVNYVNTAISVPFGYIGDVTSSDASAYPDNGELNGYYYIKIGLAPSSIPFIGVNNIARKTPSIYIGISNIARKIKKAYIGDSSNIARLIYDTSTGESSNTAHYHPCDLNITYDGAYTDQRAVTIDGKVYRVLTLTSSGTLTVNNAVTGDVWMVGGGSNARYNGGGGGGYSLYLQNISIGNTTTVVVGAGATPGYSSGGSGGGVSSFGSNSTTKPTSPYRNGGSGGGGQRHGSTYSGGTGDGRSKYPFETSSFIAYPHGAGGGGGAGKLYDEDAQEYKYYNGGKGGTNGGNGSSYSTTTYASQKASSGGNRGGGSGSSRPSGSVGSSGDGTAATYYGGGGGGAGRSYDEEDGSYDGSGYGGAGYQGIVYVRIPY